MGRTTHITLLNSEHFECSIIHNPDCINIGLRMGFTSLPGKKKDSFFVNTEIWSLSFGIEIRRRKYNDTFSN